MALLLIHTGGTIGMALGPQGFVPVHSVVENAVQALIDSGSVETEIEIETIHPLIDSAQATPGDWARVAQSIKRAQGRYDGVVVTHGSDTLAYTAGALCLLLPGLTLPVVLTGSMLPLTASGSDGVRNLTDAVQAAQTEAPGVHVQFAGQTLHGGRVRKSHSSAFDAFEAPPCDLPPVVPASAPELLDIQTHRVAVLSVTPGLCTELIAHAAERCDGLVLRCFGSGTVPDTPDLRRALERALARAVPVLAVSQCAEGGLKMGTYAAGQVLRDTGVIDGQNMSPEMAFAKMQVSLSTYDTFASQRQYLATELCGEMRG